MRTLFILAILLSILAASLALKNVLILGGTGFVGRRVIDEFINRFPAVEITSISRRGRLSTEKNDKVNWISGDANLIVKDVIQNYGPFDVCVHAVGLLLDNESGLSSLNVYASGSGSAPDSKSSYDYVTRQTAFNAIDGIKSQLNSANAPNDPVFVFISAAEAGWTFRAPITWLAKYLDAKQAVERELLSSKSSLRPVIFRPSLIWTPDRLQALPSVLPFYIGSAIGLPFVDRPVFVSSLVRAIAAAVEDKSVSGVQRYMQIDELSSRNPPSSSSGKKGEL